jgi:predicted O-methyltransferase YrrM
VLGMDPRRTLNEYSERWQLHRRLGLEPPELATLAGGLLLAEEIPGWRFRQDLALLYLLARDIPGPGTVLEIGSYQGLATTALALGARAAHRGKVHTVDPHTGDRFAEASAPPSSEEILRDNLRRAGVDQDVVTYSMTSSELAKRWDAGEVRLLFVDGWHSYDAVRCDISDWVPRLTADGVVLVDDYLNYPEVRAAVDDSRALLPDRVKTAGRMRIAYRRLPGSVARYLRIPWWGA